MWQVWQIISRWMIQMVGEFPSSWGKVWVWDQGAVSAFRAQDNEWSGSCGFPTWWDTSVASHLFGLSFANQNRLLSTYPQSIIYPWFSSFFINTRQQLLAIGYEMVHWDSKPSNSLATSPWLIGISKLHHYSKPEPFFPQAIHPYWSMHVRLGANSRLST